MRLIDADKLLRDMETSLWDWKTVDGIQTSTALRQAMTDIRNEPTVGGWISVKDRMPENTNHVLALCEVSPFKKTYKCIAMYVRPHEISEGKYPEDDTCFDYDEDEDEYYLKPGWYEIGRNFGEYGLAVIEDFVTHWMPLPEPPKEGE